MKNLVLLTLDATRRDAFGAYGNTQAITPAFDELAAQSLVFTEGGTVGPYTQASFPGILTSSYFLEYGQPRGLSPKRTLISEPLQDAGVVTAAFHSNPYLCDFLGWNRGWDTFYDSMQDEVVSRIPYIRGGVVNRKAMDWLTSYVNGGGSAPFFLWLHYMDVHEPYMPEPQYLECIDPSLSLTEDEMYALFTDVLLPRKMSDPGDVALLRKLYDAHVCEIDGYFTAFLDCLDGLGILEETAIVITNDHGDEFGEHGGLSHDDKMYNELIGMPLIVYGAEETGRCDTVVSNIDIPPTIVELFGLSPVDAFEGQSLVPTSGYESRGAYGEAIDQRAKKGGDLAKDVYFYREGPHKLIHRPGTDAWELYDLDVDPGEQSNIYGTSDAAQRLASKLLPRVRRWEA